MFVYQTGEIVNVVKGNRQLPKAVPDIQVGFEGDTPFVKFGGVSIPVTAEGGVVEMTAGITLNGVEMEVPNPDLTAKLVDGGYEIGGVMAVAPAAVCQAWGYAEGSCLFTVRVVFEGEIDNTFSGTCDGKVPNKPIDLSKFDGPNYIDYIFDGTTKVITIKYKANENAEEKTIVITNNATLANAEDAGEEEEGAEG